MTPHIPSQGQNDVTWFGELFNDPTYTISRPKWCYVIQRTFQWPLIYNLKAKMMLRDSENFSMTPHIPSQGQNDVTWFGELFNPPSYSGVYIPLLPIGMWWEATTIVLGTIRWVVTVVILFNFEMRVWGWKEGGVYKL